MTTSSSALNALHGASRVSTLTYQGYAIRAMRCPQGAAWFVLADVIRPLQLRNTSTIRKRIKDPSMVSLMNVWVPNRVNPEDSGFRDLQALSVPGLEALLGVSRVEASRALLAWLVIEAERIAQPPVHPAEPQKEAQAAPVAIPTPRPHVIKVTMPARRRVPVVETPSDKVNGHE